MTNLNLMSNQYFLYYLLLKHKVPYDDYENFIPPQGIYNIDADTLKPYMFTLSIQTSKELRSFLLVYTSYFRKCEMYTGYVDMDSIFQKADIDFIITCIFCMQYYFL